ncbi:osmoprotectant transport system permease protein [Psychromicrobium silvestre]|uniref:Osmoprotectant transport system permease protein n=1 Tax=Psychromicrobium silvestre TaxID=1645614 RepID=A0A7Y9LT27_9MICC|nr:ABC transporter permease subunit [Psychromicrobium silvestre]NYE95109.1 osmoprotectant transport system permease protein [Psychromicrobium silvestre]
MAWFTANFGHILGYAGLHLYQALLPLLLGLVIAIPLAQLARVSNIARAIILSLGSLLYTIPSLALFVVLPVVLGTQILDQTNVIVALTIYAVALLVRTTVDALNSVDNDIRQAAVALGYRAFPRFFAVDLPLSLPVLFAGLRVVSVSNIALVSVGAVIGVKNLGYYFTDGLQRDFLVEIMVGIIGTLLLAILMDVILVVLQRVLTPWSRAVASGAKPQASATLVAEVS